MSLSRPDPITRVFPGTIREDVLGHPCVVRCHLTEYLDLVNGDQVDTVSVDEIITIGTGQALFTSSLSVDQFKTLIERCRGKIRAY